ncbi:hypothetical protein Poli38472_011037 [Pythium oligandrum]|uniref:Circumsporozoite protein n=1 Tax=Pythium oligandrum TaxID=41045 RepID=A0A8K1CPK0_PYTOL|nr:hypothetical protein Poli38472_011037 [Pythium oligandrum]|eukprot:TMW67417.1 hypothetical protein Poli38472_011037 [Pythium oligandrum]
MQSFALASLAAAALAAISVSHVDAHSYMIVPPPRDFEYHIDAEGKLGCPRDKVNRVTEYKAGETIEVRHWRNNHIGGFIRYAIVPRGKESKENFDKNTFHYACREAGPECVPKQNPNDMFATDSSGDNTIRCGDKITLPDWLPAGDYVIQWTWFGVGVSFGQRGLAEPQFRSCHDIKLTTSGSKSGPPKCPTFTGGDRMSKVQKKGNDVCLYYHDNDIVNGAFKGPNDGAESKYVYGKPAAYERCMAANPAPAPTPKPEPKPSPTQAPSVKPSPNPTPAPKPSAVPSTKPSAAPSVAPTKAPKPSVAPSTMPSAAPSAAPTPEPKPSTAPSVKPSAAPSAKPSAAPSVAPSQEPKPSVAPSVKPSTAPSEPPSRCKVARN